MTLRARERQTRIYAIAQLAEKRKHKPRYPRYCRSPRRFNKRLVPRSRSSRRPGLRTSGSLREGLPANPASIIALRRPKGLLDFVEALERWYGQMLSVLKDKPAALLPPRERDSYRGHAAATRHQISIRAGIRTEMISNTLGLCIASSLSFVMAFLSVFGVLSMQAG
jgi:hypothetical protein